MRPALLLTLLLTGPAQADRTVEWFPEATVYVDVTADRQRYCWNTSHHASHLGARVMIVRAERHAVRAMWVHNSCVEEYRDRAVRDVFGIGYEYRLW